MVTTQEASKAPIEHFVVRWKRQAIEHETDPSTADFSSPLRFGGPCYDFTGNLWSVCVGLENDGLIECPNETLHSIGNDGVMPNPCGRTMQLIGEVGLCAGKIYFDAEEANIQAMSGFFVEGRFFITCSHFEPTPKAIQAERMTAMISTCRVSFIGKLKPRQGSCFIFEVCYFKIEAHDPWIRPATLIYHNTEADVSIFALKRGVPDAKHSLQWSQLVGFASIPRPSRIFTVGYNAGDDSQFAKAAKHYVLNLSVHDQSRLIQKASVDVTQTYAFRKGIF